MNTEDISSSLSNATKMAPWPEHHQEPVAPDKKNNENRLGNEENNDDDDDNVNENVAVNVNDNNTAIITLNNDNNDIHSNFNNATNNTNANQGTENKQVREHQTIIHVSNLSIHRSIHRLTITYNFIKTNYDIRSDKILTIEASIKW